jgi:hypothetical protein
MKKQKLTQAAFAFALLAMIASACGRIATVKTPAATDNKQLTPAQIAAQASATPAPLTGDNLALSIKDLRLRISAASTASADESVTTTDDTNEAPEVGTEVASGEATGKVVTLSLYSVTSKVPVDQDDTGKLAYPKPFTKLTGTIDKDGNATLVDAANSSYTAVVKCKLDGNNCKTSAVVVTQLNGAFQVKDAAAGKLQDSVAAFRHLMIDDPTFSLQESATSKKPNGPLAQLVTASKATAHESSGHLVIDEVSGGSLFVRYEFKFKDPAFDKKSGSISTESGVGVPAQIRFYTKQGTTIQNLRNAYKAGVNYDDSSKNILIQFSRADLGVQSFTISAKDADLMNPANTVAAAGAAVAAGAAAAANSIDPNSDNNDVPADVVSTK